MEQEKGFLVIQTGGTIDKRYPRANLGYAFEIMEPAVKRVLTRAKVLYKVETVTVCRKDSQDITQADRLNLLEVCKATEYKQILITHGTDSLLDTAEYLAKHALPKTIVLTGAFLPEAFKDSDADFNVGCAVGALQVLSDRSGVFVTMNGYVQPWDSMIRDQDAFMQK